MMAKWLKKKLQKKSPFGKVKSPQQTNNQEGLFLYPLDESEGLTCV